MEFDKETLIKITQTHTNVQHILKQLNHGTKTFQNHTTRIQELEKKHQLMKGRLGIVVKLVTGIITVVIGSALYLWVRLISR